MTNNTHTLDNSEENGFNITGILLIVNYYSKKILRKWYIIIPFGILGALIGFLLFNRLEKQYVAKTSFLISQGEGGGGSGVVNVLSGFGLGGLGGGGSKSPETILAISQSDTIYNKSLSQKTRDTAIVYRLAERYNSKLETEEVDNYDLDSFLLPKVDWPEGNKIVFQRLKTLLRGEDNEGGLVSTNLEEGTGIMELIVSTKSEDLSVILNNSLLNATVNYYVNYSTEPQKLALKEINKRTDSLEFLISKLIRKRALLGDRQQGLQMRINRIEATQTELDLRVASDAYAVAVQNKETASFALNSRIPAFQILSTPSTPLITIKPNLLKYCLGGFALFSTFSALILTGIIFVQTALLREKKFEI